MSRKSKNILKEGPGAGVDFKVRNLEILGENPRIVLQFPTQDKSDYKIVKSTPDFSGIPIELDLLMESYYDGKIAKTKTNLILSPEYFLDDLFNELSYELDENEWNDILGNYLYIELDNIVAIENTMYGRGYTRSNLSAEKGHLMDHKCSGYFNIYAKNDSGNLYDLTMDLEIEMTMSYAVNKTIATAYNALDNYSEEEVFDAFDEEEWTYYDESKNIKKESYEEKNKKLMSKIPNLPFDESKKIKDILKESTKSLPLYLNLDIQFNEEVLRENNIETDNYIKDIKDGFKKDYKVKFKKEDKEMWGWIGNSSGHRDYIVVGSEPLTEKNILNLLKDVKQAGNFFINEKYNTVVYITDERGFNLTERIYGSLLKELASYFDSSDTFEQGYEVNPRTDISDKEMYSSISSEDWNSNNGVPNKHK